MFICQINSFISSILLKACYSTSFPMFFLKIQIEGLKKELCQHCLFCDIINSACNVSSYRWRERGLPFWSGSRQVNENGPYSKFRTGELFIFGSKSLFGHVGMSSCMCCPDRRLFSECQSTGFGMLLLPNLQYSTEHTVWDTVSLVDLSQTRFLPVLSNDKNLNAK